MKLLSLDFDGVISDSAPESFEVALRTYRAIEGPGMLRARERSELYRAFLELMPLGNRAEDFGAALRALDAGVALPDQAAYDSFRSGLDTRWLDEFHERFYRERRAFARAEPERWSSLLGPYPAFLDILRRRAGTCSYAIATAKDRHSVGTLLENYGIRDLFPEERVFDKETGTSKVSHHEEIVRRSGLSPADITFIDDKVNHLDAVSRLGVRCALATWGYNGDREHALARERGYLVCALADVEATLFAS